ncbi:MAG: DUF1161 domain-containing protein [Betaproteobacteria bacterium]|nr:DUF1161 domain-containing protein [Betaproteobacteria bacterium]
MKKLVLVSALLIACNVALADSHARKSCEELKAEITAKIEANKVPKFALEIVDNDKVGGGSVVGSCDGDTKKIVHTRG